MNLSRGNGKVSQLNSIIKIISKAKRTDRVLTPDKWAQSGSRSMSHFWRDITHINGFPLLPGSYLVDNQDPQALPEPPNNDAVKILVPREVDV